MADLENLLSPKELSRILRISPVTAYKWAEQGVLPSYKLEGVVRFDPADIREFLEKRRRISQK